MRKHTQRELFDDPNNICNISIFSSKTGQSKNCKAFDLTVCFDCGLTYMRMNDWIGCDNNPYE